MSLSVQYAGKGVRITTNLRTSQHCVYIPRYIVLSLSNGKEIPYPDIAKAHDVFFLLACLHEMNVQKNSKPHFFQTILENIGCQLMTPPQTPSSQPHSNLLQFPQTRSNRNK